MHSNICAHLSASVNEAARLQLPEQPVGALLRKRTARRSVDSPLPLPYGSERSNSCRALRCTPRQSPRHHASAVAPSPWLHPGALPQSPLITSKRSLCFLFWFSICLFISSPSQHPPPPTPAPPFFSSCLQTEALPRTALLACLDLHM